MSGDVLTTDAPEGLGVQGMSIVASQGARESGGGVEVSGVVAVVDGEDEAGMERSRERSGQVVEGEVDLGPLTFYEADVEFGKSLLEEGVEGSSMISTRVWASTPT